MAPAAGRRVAPPPAHVQCGREEEAAEVRRQALRGKLKSSKQQQQQQGAGRKAAKKGGTGASTARAGGRRV